MASDMLENLLDISRKLAETRELSPLLDYAMDIALEFVGAEFGYLVLLGENESLEFRVRRNTAGYTMTDEQIEISHSILIDAIHDRKPLLSGNALIDPLYTDSESVQAFKIRSVMCVPLISRDHVIGGLYVENRTEADMFSQSDLRALQFFASQAAIAIENAMLNDDLEARVQERTLQLQRKMEEHKRTEAKMIEMALERERVKLLSVFLQDAAHEFRTPISSAKTALYLLCKTTNIDMIENRHVQMANASLDSLEELINQMMLLTNLDMGWADTSMAKLQVNGLLRTIVIVVQNRLHQKQLTLDINYLDQSISVFGNAEMLHTALLQIINNAITFTPEGGRVSIELAVQDDHVNITIHDNGIGIPADEIDNIFTRFYRIDPSRSQRGFGLGLPIADRIIQIHNGYLNVSSSVGEGSSFLIALPLAMDYR